MDPNSQNQTWSHWVFVVHDGGRLVPRSIVKDNAARWLNMGFGSAGAFELRRTMDGWRFDLRVEGVPAQDPAYVASVRREFAQRFVAPGWGPIASSSVSVRLLAGKRDDGKPPDQWIVAPTIGLETVEG